MKSLYIFITCPYMHCRLQIYEILYHSRHLCRLPFWIPHYSPSRPGPVFVISQGQPQTKKQGLQLLTQPRRAVESSVRPRANCSAGSLSVAASRPKEGRMGRSQSRASTKATGTAAECRLVQKLSVFGDFVRDGCQSSWSWLTRYFLLDYIVIIIFLLKLQCEEKHHHVAVRCALKQGDCVIDKHGVKVSSIFFSVLDRNEPYPEHR